MSHLTISKPQTVLSITNAYTHNGRICANPTELFLDYKSKKLKDINKEDTNQTTERKTEENSDALRTILRHTLRF